MIDNTKYKKPYFVLTLCFGIFVLMLSLSFAAVPLYKLFCQVTGYGGTPQIAIIRSSDIGERNFIIRYDTNISPELNWEVEPEFDYIEIATGENVFTYYKAKNVSDIPIDGTATYNVVPAEAAAYFMKVECFCFTEQRLEPNQIIDMPLVFYIDPAIDRDRDLKNVDTITLSYTFYENKVKRSDIIKK